MEALYSYRDKVFARDRTFFRASVETHLEERVPAIRQWIMSHAKAIVVSAREAQQEDLRGVIPLTAYFPWQYAAVGD